MNTCSVGLGRMVRMQEELERLKDVCRRIEPWATAGSECVSLSPASGDVLMALIEMRQIIYGPNKARRSEGSKYVEPKSKGS